MTGYPEVMPRNRTFNDAGQKSASRRSPVNLLEARFTGLIVSEVFNECIGLFSTVESLAFNHIPRLADFTGLIVQM
jgi:hypothetical protein